MAGQASVAIPEILVRPILQRVTLSQAVVWMVTSVALDPKKVRGEVWDPLPPGMNGFISEPNPRLPLAGSIEVPTDVETRKAAPKVWVYRIRLRAAQNVWPTNRVLAYRIAPHGGDWIQPSEGVEPLPGGQGPDPRSPNRSFNYPWFSVDPTKRQWAILSLSGQAPSSWIQAETYVSRLSRGSARLAPNAANASGPNVPSGRPTTALLFSADAVPQDLEILERIKWEIGRDFASPDFGSYFLSKCLAVSPALWDFGTSAPAPPITVSGTPPSDPLSRQSVVALSKIAAHVPLYGLPSQLFQAVGTLEKMVANEAFSLCFLWGNQNLDLVSPALPEVDPETDYAAGEPPSVGVLFSVPDNLMHPDEQRGANRVFPSLVVATPTPVLPISPPASYQSPRLGAFDNLFALSADDYSYLNVPDGQIDEKAQMRDDADRGHYVRQPWALTGRAARRVYQLAVASGTGSSPPRSKRRGRERNWNARTLSYGDGPAADMLQASAAFSVMSSEAARDSGVDWPGFRLAFFSNANQGRSLTLIRLGHRVIPQANADIYLGNRFRFIDQQVDNNLLAGIQVLINGQQRATTQADGRAIGLQAFLGTQLDDEYTLSISGQITQDDPPDPSTSRRRGDRQWRRRSFKIHTRGGQIVQVDDEYVVSPGVRILLDPVYMRLPPVSGFAANPNRPGPVSMVQIHRTDVPDTLHTLRTWHSAQGFPFTAQYILARDGTLIKGADENEVIIHGGGRWLHGAGAIINMNAVSVGIEITKADDPSDYTEAQYATLLWLLWQYVNATPPVSPVDIIGHSDVRPNGKDDPGLEFEWSRLEAEGFGLRRAENPLTGPLPEVPPLNVNNFVNQEFRIPTDGFQEQINRDLAAYPALFAAELALGTQQARNAAVDARVLALIHEIGYNQARHPEVWSFRSHFFSGARRMYFAFSRLNLNAAPSANNPWQLMEQELGRLDNPPPVDMRALTAVWAQRVRDYVVGQRQAANPARPKQQPMPPPPR